MCNKHCVYVLSLWICLIVAAEASEPGQIQVVHLEPFHGPDVSDVTHYGNCQWLYPQDEPNEALQSEPEYGSEKPIYYAARYGDAEDNIFTISLDETGGTGTGYDTLYADLNNDNRLDGKTERYPITMSGLTTREKAPVNLCLQVRSGGKTIPYSFEFTAFRYKGDRHPIEKVHANCRNSTIFTGYAEWGGKRCKMAVADLDSNGLFNDYEKGIFNGDRIFVDFDGDGVFRSTSGQGKKKESFPYARYSEIDGNWYRLEVTPDGGTLSIQAARPTFGQLTGDKDVYAVNLVGPEQFLSLELNDGAVKAITGDYSIYSIAYRRKDDAYRTWTLEGSFRRDEYKIPISIKKNAPTKLPEFLPLFASVEPKTTTEKGTLSLEPRLVNGKGLAFRFPYVIEPHHQKAEGALEVRDNSGKIILSKDFEYG